MPTSYRSICTLCQYQTWQRVVANARCVSTGHGVGDRARDLEKDRASRNVGPPVLALDSGTTMRPPQGQYDHERVAVLVVARHKTCIGQTVPLLLREQ
eukprot:1965235-Rhodomonas_salina.1